MQHAKHAIFWNEASTPFYEARQARKRATFIDHAST